MRRRHPLWRGFYLALVLTATLLLTGGPEAIAPFQGARRALAGCMAVTAGAFLAQLPSRLRKGRARPAPASWKRCAVAFFCGMVLTLSAGMAGDGRILPALMQGSTGAFAFVGAAWAAGFVTTRAAGRRQA